MARRANYTQQAVSDQEMLWVYGSSLYNDDQCQAELQ